MDEDEIFVVGMSCRAPLSDNIEEYWNNLVQGVDMSSFSDERWPRGAFGLPTKLGLVKDITKFDANFFTVTNEQALNMDPQIKLLLEVVVESIFDSGISPEDFHYKPTGIYTSVLKSESSTLGHHLEETNTSMHAAKLARFLKTNGPTICVDCACSSALVAIHLARNDLLLKKTSIAIVTGASILLSPNQSLQNLKLGMLSPDGQCHVWDEKANGYLRSEGVYSVILGRGKKFPRIYAQVLKSATNSDGFKSEGITYPSREAQVTLLKNVYEEISISKVVYIECHATGTQAGDPTETGAICDVMDEQGYEGPLLIGSCKSNHGHAEWAAGLASFIKATLCLYKGEIPPNRNFENVNPKIQGIIDGKLVPVTELINIPYGLVGVTAMGFGGSNCHVLLKAFVPEVKLPEISSVLLLFLASRTKRGLIKQENLLSTETLTPHTCVHLNRAFGYSASNLVSLHRQAWLLSEKLNISSALFHKTSEITSTCGELWLIIHDVAITSGIESSWDDESNTLRAHFNLIHRFSTETERIYLQTLDDHLSLSTIRVLALITLLKESGLTFDGVIGCGFSDLIAAVLDETVKRSKVIQLMAVCGNQVNRLTPKSERVVFQVNTTSDIISSQFWYACIISYNTFYSLYVSVPIDKSRQFQLKLNTMNISFQSIDLFNNCLYTREMTPISEALKESLQLLDPSYIVGQTPTNRSTKWLNTRFTSLSFPREVIESEIIAADYISRVCRTPTALNGATCRIPLRSTRIHCGITKRPTWIPEDDLYVNARSTLDVFKLLTALYLRGYEVDPNVLTELDGTVPPGTPNIGHFVQWDHSKTWPVPHWLQFSATMKEEKMRSNYVIQWNGELMSMLHAIWTRINLSCQNDPENVLELCDLETDLSQCRSTCQQFRLEVFETSKKFVATGEKFIMQGRFKFHDSSFVTEKLSPPQPTSEIDAPDSLPRPKVFKLTWTDSWIDFLTELHQQLDGLLRPHGKRNCILSLALSTKSMPSIGESVSITVDLITGICVGGGVYLTLVPVEFELLNSNIYPRTSSNVSLFESIEEADESVIKPSPNWEFTTTKFSVHAVRLYQIRSAPENNPTWILVHCGQNDTSNHCLGLSLITQERITVLVNSINIPLDISCTEAISFLIPFLLSSSVTQSFENVYSPRDEEVVVISDNCDSLFHFLLTTLSSNFQFKTIAVVPRYEEKSQYFTLNDTPVQSDLSRISISQRQPLEPIFLTTSDNDAPPLASTPNKSILEIPHITVTTDQSYYSINTRSSRDQTSSISEKDVSRDTEVKLTTPQTPAFEISGHSTLASDQMVEELFPNVKFIPLDELADIVVKKEIECRPIRKIISLQSDLVKWANVLSCGGHLIHIGELKTSVSSPLDTEIFTNKSVISLEPLNCVTKMVEQIDIAFLSEGNLPSLSWDAMWTCKDKMKMLLTTKPEDNGVYQSSSTVSFVYPMSLNVVQKHMQKKLKDKTTSEDFPFKDTTWLGKLQCLASVGSTNSDHKSSIPTFESHSFNLDQSSPAVFRPQTSIPRVYCLTPEMEKEEVKQQLEIRPTKREDGSQSPITGLNAEIAVPLTRLDGPPIFKMNSKTEGQTAFLVHPVTGVLTTLIHFASELPVPCYGIKQTTNVPTDSLINLARYYLKHCLEIVGDKQFTLIGYSYGACVAFVMSLEAQLMDLKNQPQLILLDGSPHYLKLPLDIIRSSYSPPKVQSILDAEMLIAFLQIYGNVETGSIRSALIEASDREERIKVGVNYLSLCAMPRPPSNRWQVISRQILSTSSPKFVSTAREVMQLQRIKRARSFLSNMDLIDEWNYPETKLKSDVYLCRIEDSPPHCPSLPSDYGLKELISGQLTIKKYSTSHEGLVGPRNTPKLISDLLEVLI